MGLFGKAENYNSGHISYSKTIGKTNQGEEHYFMGQKEEMQRGCLNSSPLGKSESPGG